MKKVNIAILLAIALVQFTCSDEKKKEQVISETRVEEVEDKNEESKDLPPENFIDLLDLENHQTLIDKDKNSNFISSIDDFLIDKLQLKEVFGADLEIYSVSIPKNISQDYHTLIIGLENTCCFYETYLVAYSLEGKFIDSLLITEGDYIESFTHLESKIDNNKINRTMYRENYNVEPSVDENWKEDEFTIDDKGKFKGEDLIFSDVKDVKKSNDNFIGHWKKEDSSNPIDPTFFDIKKNSNNSYSIKFSNTDYFVPTNFISDTLTGNSSSGSIKMVFLSENPVAISYSDDGRGGHFDPVKNERFIKEEAEKSLLIGKWQSTDDENNFIEFTGRLKIESNIRSENIEKYTLSNTCLNGEGIESEKKEYISGLKSGMCWYIISIDNESLSLSFVGRGNTLNYKRVN